MSDKKNDAQSRADAAGARAQSDAASGASGDLTATEPYSGAGEDGDVCTLTDGREGVVRATAKGMVCTIEPEQA